MIKAIGSIAFDLERSEVFSLSFKSPYCDCRDDNDKLISLSRNITSKKLNK